MIIAFIGSSGSGKSYLINEFRKEFSQGSVDIIKEDNFIFLVLFKKIFGEKVFRRYNRTKLLGTKNESIQDTLFSKFVPVFYPIFIYLEYLILYLYYQIIFKNKVALFDRFVYDYLVTFKANLGVSATIIDYFFKKFPRPNLVLYISITPKTALSRNKNKEKGFITNSFSFHKNVLEKYKNMSKELHFFEITNNSIRDKAKKRISQIFKRYKKVARLKSLAIIGMDGSGKTTLANNVKKQLLYYGIKSNVVHFYNAPIVLKLLDFLGVISKEKAYKENYSKNLFELRKLKNRGKSFFWAFLHFSDATIQFFFYKFTHSKSLLIFDRYFYDYLVSFKYYKVNSFDFFSKIIWPADRVFLLLAKPKIVFRRKPENLLSFFEFAYQEYVFLAKRLNFLIISSDNKNENEIVDELIEHI